MKLSALAKRPQLIEITLDDPELVQEYGEPITFWTWDRHDIATLMQLSGSSQDHAEIIRIMQPLIMTESGEPIMRDGQTLPSRVLMAAIACLVSQLGK